MRARDEYTAEERQSAIGAWLIRLAEARRELMALEIDPDMFGFLAGSTIESDSSRQMADAFVVKLKQLPSLQC